MARKSDILQTGIILTDSNKEMYDLSWKDVIDILRFYIHWEKWKKVKTTSIESKAKKRKTKG
jgi:hypothetical protein